MSTSLRYFDTAVTGWLGLTETPSNILLPIGVGPHAWLHDRW
jgi:hypothetical protein